MFGLVNFIKWILNFSLQSLTLIGIFDVNISYWYSGIFISL